MKNIILLVSALLLAPLVAISPVNGEEPTSSADRAEVSEALPALPATPAAVDGIVYARKFTLTEGYKFTWSKESPEVVSGWLLVLKVKPNLVYARQCEEPVLYVGSQSAQRLNVGYRSGHVVAIVPGHPDLKETPIWFGTPQLPERVDANTARAELTLARNAGIEPFAAADLDKAGARGGSVLEASNVVDVLRVAADLIREYSPAEDVLINSLAPAPKPAVKVTPKSDEED